MTTTFARTSAVLPTLRILTAGLTVGTLDLIFAFSFWALRDVSPVRILQSIAAGVQGTAAFAGGASSALLGAACHYLIATVMVLAYYLAGRRVATLLEHPVRYGLPYGLLLYAAMTWIAVPLSNAPVSQSPDAAWMVASLAMHLVLGMVCARFARHAHGR